MKHKQKKKILKNAFGKLELLTAIKGAKHVNNGCPQRSPNSEKVNTLILNNELLLT